jgi:hypothetical protein
MTASGAQNDPASAATDSTFELIHYHRRPRA